ncbi:CIA30 family protein [Arsukibacterium sp.]|uniref:CIA30 family protein n=1 Tax=Arsukibacterium sp. TaxID=1977258 RepID=UPI001BD20870|nr:CIA30 family protein [Arsukibacterium sp.]
MRDYLAYAIITLFGASAMTTGAAPLKQSAATALLGGEVLQFHNSAHFSTVQLIHDTVMGGRSDGSLAMLSEPAGLRFSGNLSLANNGGFASAEFRLAKPLPAESFNSVKLTVAADGRLYQLRLKTPYIPQGVAYVANFKTVEGQKDYYFQPTAFNGQFRGRTVTNLPELRLADISHVSVMLADKRSGAYSIVLYSIELSALQSI